MKQNWKNPCLWITASVIALSGAGGIQALAGLIGTGSQEQPFEGTVQKGDLLQPEVYLKNLAEQDGRKIHLKPLYTPKQYPLVFDANGGAFADGAAMKEETETYNDASEIFDAAQSEAGYLGANHARVQLPSAPQRENYQFAGWYLKGNQRPEKPGEADGTLLTEDTRYMIANDEGEDLGRTDTTGDGKPIARALWRINAFVPESDGNEADLPETGAGDDNTEGGSGADQDSGTDQDSSAGGGAGNTGTGGSTDEGAGNTGGNTEGSTGGGTDGGTEGGGASGGASKPGNDGTDTAADLWDPAHVNNQVIEKLDGMDKTAYRKAHGPVTRQYGRVILNAETSLATGYQWYKKGRGDTKFVPMEGENSNLCRLDNLTRRNNGEQYRCEVSIGEEGDRLVYETKLTVYYLPEIKGTEVLVNGQKKHWTEA